MQSRPTNPTICFEEAAASCLLFYIPYLRECAGIEPGPGCRVLEVGCGVGGTLSVFAAAGCVVTGVDLHPGSIAEAESIFARKALRGRFFCTDFRATPPQRIGMIC